jgi:hypothetical protein
MQATSTQSKMSNSKSTENTKSIFIRTKYLTNPKIIIKFVPNDMKYESLTFPTILFYDTAIRLLSLLSVTS